MSGTVPIFGLRSCERAPARHSKDRQRRYEETIRAPRAKPGPARQCPLFGPPVERLAPLRTLWRPHGVLSTRRGHDGGRRVYDQLWYLCSNARNEGPAVCKHATRYHADLFEGAVVEQFRTATTYASIDRMIIALNEAVDRALRDESRSPKKLAAEIARLKKRATNPVRFLAEGGSSEAVRGELTTTEQRIASAEAELAASSNPPARIYPKAHRQWLLAKLEHLQELLAKDPARAKAEIARHLAGNLSLRALPPPPPNATIGRSPAL